MSNERARNGFVWVALAIFGMAFLGGCTPVDPAALDTFVADLLRGATAALLL